MVLDGILEVKIDNRIVGVLTRGDAFGETAFLLDHPRTADVYAATPGPKVLSMSDGALRELIATNPQVAAKFLLNLSRMLCARLIKANRAQSDCCHSDNDEWTPWDSFQTPNGLVTPRVATRSHGAQ